MSIGKNLNYVSKQKLIEYVKNPELAAAVNIPAAAALYELQNRVVLEQEAEALKNKEAMAQGSQSIADKTIAASQTEGLPAAMNFAQNNQPMDDSGVASLDTGDMYNEQNFAGGGIVAFAEGGNTGMNLDELPTLNVNTGVSSLGGSSGMGGDALYSFNDKYAMSPVGRMLLSKMPQSDRAKFIGSGIGTFFGLQERPKQEYYTSSGDLTSRYAQGGVVAFDNGGDVDLTTRSRFDTLTDEEKQVIAAQYGLGADLGNQRGSIGAEYAGIVNQQGVSAPRGELRGRYMTDEGNQYNARYMPDARALSVDRNAGRSSVGADVAPGPDNSMGLRSIRGSYITDDGTRYGAGYNVDSRQALLERINQEGSRLGLNVSRDGVGAQYQFGFAQGGEVKHYAYGKGVKTDPELYDPFYYKDASAALVPTRNVPTAGEYFKDQRAAETELGIDPDYVKNRMKDIAAANETETDSAKRMANANMLFAMSDALSSTPGSLLKGLSRAAPAGLKAGTEALKDLRELEKAKREAQNKLNDAEYSQKRGDAQGYMKNINEYKTLNANIEMKNAELETSMRIANLKERASKTGKGYEIFKEAAKLAQDDFNKRYPDSALKAAFVDDTSKLNAVQKQLLEKHLNILMGNIEDAYGPQTAVAQPSVAQPGVNRRPITEFAGS